MSEQLPLITPPSRRAGRDAPRLSDLMIFVGALAFGLWLSSPIERHGNWMVLATLLLGSLASLGPPFLIVELLRSRRRMGPGRFVWLVTGLSSWMLWPAELVRRIVMAKVTAGISLACFTYVTPLMGLMLMIAFAIGGRLRLRKGWRTPWREAFGRWLGLAWCLLGLYVLYVLYEDDFFRR